MYSYTSLKFPISRKVLIRFYYNNNTLADLTVLQLHITGLTSHAHSNNLTNDM